MSTVISKIEGADKLIVDWNEEQTDYAALLDQTLEGINILFEESPEHAATLVEYGAPVVANHFRWLILGLQTIGSIMFKHDTKEMDLVKQAIDAEYCDGQFGEDTFLATTKVMHYFGYKE